MEKSESEVWEKLFIIQSLLEDQPTSVPKTQEEEEEFMKNEAEKQQQILNNIKELPHESPRPEKVEGPKGKINPIMKNLQEKMGVLC